MIHIIRKSELKDYLAARKCGLLILRYAERILSSNNKYSGLPDSFTNKKTKYGYQSFTIDESNFGTNDIMYFSQLRDTFWIDPASKPRRWDAQMLNELKEEIPFTLEDGELSTYKQDGNDLYFKVISFNPSLFSDLLLKRHHKITFHCLTNFSIQFPNGDIFECCLNKEGQPQCFFGLINKLDSKNQSYLSAYSEPKKADITPEYSRVFIAGEFPLTYSFDATLSKCLRLVNKPWIEKYGKALLLSPSEKNIFIKMRVGPISDNFDELIDIMLEMQKIVLPEYEINEIKKKLDYSNCSPNLDEYEIMKSGAYTRLMFKAHSPDKTEGTSIVLKIISDLRNCKGHPKNLDKILRKHGLSKKNSREIFHIILSEFCQFLLDFKDITECLVGTDFEKTPNENYDSWEQLKIIRKYFQDPF